MRKFEPVSAGAMYVDWFTLPGFAPAARVTAIVAGGSAQTEDPPAARVNFTGTTPTLTLNTLLPFAAIGDWIVAL